MRNNPRRHTAKTTHPPAHGPNDPPSRAVTEGDLHRAVKLPTVARQVPPRRAGHS
jgi:hypothetical protein